MRQTATATLFLVCCVGPMACSTVIVEREDELASSASSVGSSTGGPSSDPGSGGGAGAGTIATPSGTGGGGGAPETVACTSLAWSEATLAPTEMNGGDRVVLADLSKAGPQALYLGRDDIGPRRRIAHLRAIDGAWGGPLTFRDECYPRQFRCDAVVEDPWYPAAPVATSMVVVWECPELDWRDRDVERAEIRPVGAPSNDDLSLLVMEPVRDMAGLETGAEAYVGGAERLGVMTYVHVEDVWYQPVAVDACADRPVPADVIAHEGRFALAYGTTVSGSCDGAEVGPPSLARVGVFDAGGAVVDVATLDLGAPIVELHLVATTGGLHVVARTEEGAGPALSVLRVGATAELERIAQVELAADRSLAVAAMGDRLAIVDAGEAEPRLHARVFDEGGALEAESTVAPEGILPVGSIGALGSNGALLVGFMDEAAGAVQHGLVRVECRGEE